MLLRWFYLTLALILWSALGGGFIVRAFARKLVSACRRWPRGVVFIGPIAQLVALALFGLVCVAGWGLTVVTGSDVVAFVTVLPACLLYMPLTVWCRPRRLRYLRDWARALQEAGADRWLADTLARSGAIVAWIGFVCALVPVWFLAERL